MEEQIDKILKNMKLNPDPTGVSSKEEEVELSSEEYVQEYDFLNSTLDNIDSCLSALEQQNDDLCSQLRDMLVSSKNSQDAPPSADAEGTSTSSDSRNEEDQTSEDSTDGTNSDDTSQRDNSTDCSNLDPCEK